MKYSVHYLFAILLWFCVLTSLNVFAFKPPETGVYKVTCMSHEMLHILWVIFTFHEKYMNDIQSPLCNILFVYIYILRIFFICLWSFRLSPFIDFCIRVTSHVLEWQENVNVDWTRIMVFSECGWECRTEYSFVMSYHWVASDYYFYEWRKSWKSNKSIHFTFI